jgi:hypothetical protein
VAHSSSNKNRSQFSSVFKYWFGFPFLQEHADVADKLKFGVIMHRWDLDAGLDPRKELAGYKLNAKDLEFIGDLCLAFVDHGRELLVGLTFGIHAFRLRYFWRLELIAPTN